MARKKSARRKQKEACEDDTSDEEFKTYQTKACSHVAKAVNLTRLKKAFKGISNVEKCKDCKEKKPENVPSVANAEGGDEELEVTETWLCLQCGYRGCGRTSSEKHAVLHFKTPHSDCHSVVLGLSSSSVWCYSCDNSVHTDSSRSLKDCVEFVLKQKEKKIPNHVMVNGDKKLPLAKASSSTTVNEEKVEKESTPPKSKEAAKKNPWSNKACPPASRTIKGLRNLGNTCFFNAVLQNLCQTPWLFPELERSSEKGFVWELPYPVEAKHHDAEVIVSLIGRGRVTSNTSATWGVPTKFSLLESFPLTQAFLNFLKLMNKPSQSQKTEVVNPSTLFDQICKKSPQFCGFHQQDSHELLRQLLDGIRNEEIKRQRKAILKAFNISEKGKADEVDEETKHLIKAYGSFASHTVVEKIFGGQLLSTVVCEECKGSSQVFEPFMDLSLPLIEEKVMRTGKSTKHGADDYGMQCLSKKKDDTGISRHQEKKMKQQAKKASKKRAKMKTEKSSSVEEKDFTLMPADIADKTEKVDDSNIESAEVAEKIEGEGSIDNENLEDNQESDNDLSDADVEDNDETESIPKNKEVPPKEDPEYIADLPRENSFETNKSHVLEELCSQITEIRIRRDSDKQEDLLESIDKSHANSTKHRKSFRFSDVDDVEDPASGNDWSHSQSDEQAKEWMMRSLTTLKARYQPASKECSVNSCLNQFTASELLTGSNQFRCENCTKLHRERTGKDSKVVYSNASKQLLIFSPPAVLTLHLKRFQQTGMSLRKLNSFVEFPEILDLAPYCSSICLRLPHMSEVQDEVLYSLYGIVQHSGRLTEGHYTAYVKLQDNHANPAFLNNWPMGQCNLEQLLDKISKVKLPSDLPYKSRDNTWYKWYYVSDNMFKEVNESEVMQCQAYILFYQRIK